MSGLKGVGSISRPKLVGVWILRCSDLRGLGFGSFGIRTQEGWGIDPCPDQKELGFESFNDQTQGVWVLQHLELKGLLASFFFF